MFEPRAVTELGEALGLRSVSAVSTDRRGVVDGVAVRVRSAFARRGDLDLVVEARAEHGLDLGFWARQALPFGGDASIPTGDARFDGVFSVGAAAGHEDLARAILDDALRAALTRLVNVGSPAVSDEGVAVSISSVHLTADALRASVDDCVRVALALDRAGASLPAPNTFPPEWSGAFADACRELGLSHRAHPMTAVGVCRGVWLRARWRTRALPWTLGALALDGAETIGYRLSARFERPLDADLRAEPAGLADRLKDLVGLGDLSLGDPDFDRAWRVRASDPALAAEVLNPTARARLRELWGLGLRFTLDDRGVDGRGDPPTAPHQLPEVLRRVVTLRDALRPSTASGPYR